MTLYLMNSSVLTSEGTFTYKRISLNEARKLTKNGEFNSAIGHQSTAHAMSKILHVDVPCQRVEIFQKPGDVVLVFKLDNRLPEGKILSEQEVYDAGFKWFLLTKKEV